MLRRVDPERPRGRRPYCDGNTDAGVARARTRPCRRRRNRP
jgi:hypothetical protein